MQRMMSRTNPPLARTALCALLPAALWGCSPDLAIGDVSSQDQALDQAPAAASTPEVPAPPSAAELGPAQDGLVDAAPAPMPDLSIAPQLAPPDVTMRIDVPGTGEVALSGVGDLDGDGFADFAIESADFTNHVEFVHIRYGGPRPAQAGDAFALEQSGARLLMSNFLYDAIEVLTPAGDVDGDGFGDLLIGLTRCDPAQTSEGAFLLYGGPQRLSGVQRIEQVAVQLRDPRERAVDSQSSCYSGIDPHVAALGDIDGDGFDDFVIADQRVSGSSTAYLFYGSAQRLASGASLLDADARFALPGDIVPTATGDVNADGSADLLLSAMDPSPNPSSYFLPGSGQRWQGDLDPTVVATNIGTLFPFTGTGLGLPRPALYPAVLSPPDLDGDGAADLLFWSFEGTRHLFYGQPGLFATGADVSQSVVLGNEAELHMDVWFAGDRDGDGDVELSARFYVEDHTVANDLAFVSGSRQRASGSLPFPVQAVLEANPSSSLREEGRFLEGMSIAGDLDGDGAGDLLTTSSWYEITELEDGGFSFSSMDPELHIHYGVPGTVTLPVR